VVEQAIPVPQPVVQQAIPVQQLVVEQAIPVPVPAQEVAVLPWGSLRNCGPTSLLWDRRATSDVTDMTLVEVHSVLGWALVVANAAAGLWALGAQWLPRLRVTALWWFVAAAQSLLFVQAVVGVVLYTSIEGPAPRIHMFYGFLTLVAVAILYGYRVPMGQRRYVLYGLGSLFIMGLGLQSMANSSVLSM